MEEDETKDSPLGGNDASSDDDTSQSETELMVTTRARRVTAGNRYNALVAQEEPEQDEEDEVAMLFAEGEGEDVDFNSDEGDEDADMSSSDDDDQGPNVATEDLEGEQEIQKEAKAERAKKRKADLALTTVSGLRKKPRIDPTSLRRAPAPKPSKRKERVSWLPESDTAPGRTSLRKQTILHRAETHAKLKVNEEQRLRLKAKREKREREKEATAPKEMTQADRLAEAERVERRNAKSLNRWEAMEKKRAEEQAARLAALRERKLEGAVVTWYSSKAKYVGVKEIKHIDIEVPTEPKKRGRKPKALLEQLAAARLANEQRAILAPKHAPTTETSQASQQNVPPVNASVAASSQPTTSPVSTGTEHGTTSLAIHAGPSSTKAVTDSETEKKSDEPLLTGIHEYASMPSETRSRTPSTAIEPEELDASKDPPQEYSPSTPLQEAPVPTEQTDEQKPSGHESSLPIDAHPEEDMGPTQLVQRMEVTMSEVASPTVASNQKYTVVNDNVMSDIDTGVTRTIEPVLPHADKITQPQLQTEQKLTAIINGQASSPAIIEIESTQSQATPNNISNIQSAPKTLPLEPPVEVISTRNIVILDRFDDLSDQARQDFGLFYNNRKTGKPVKHSQELCAVTGLPARYRDPATGIAYANAAAYKKLQELKKHRFTWSSMLGCYVGRSDIVARGVPEGFLGL